jgi:transposase
MIKGGKPFFALKKNTTVKESDPYVWKGVVSFARENTGEWEKIYHLRSYVEAIFSAIKRRFGEKLTAIKKRIRRKQLALKVLAYTIKQALYDKTAVTLDVPYWVAW